MFVQFNSGEVQQPRGLVGPFTPLLTPDRLRAMKATLPEREIVTRKGNPVSVIKMH
jgi:hypothetical protein